MVVESFAFTESLISSIAGIGWYFLVAVSGLRPCHERCSRIPCDSWSAFFLSVRMPPSLIRDLKVSTWLVLKLPKGMLLPSSYEVFGVKYSGVGASSGERTGECGSEREPRTKYP